MDKCCRNYQSNIISYALLNVRENSDIAYGRDDMPLSYSHPSSTTKWIQAIIRSTNDIHPLLWAELVLACPTKASIDLKRFILSVGCLKYSCRELTSMKDAIQSKCVVYIPHVVLVAFRHSTQLVDDQSGYKQYIHV
jgi:hypothetical protein